MDKNKQHWFETKNMRAINRKSSLKKKAVFTHGSGNKRKDNDILLTLGEDEVFQIEIKWLEQRSKVGNIIISRRDWEHLDEQAAPFNIPLIITGHSKLELVSMKLDDLLNILDTLQKARESIASLKNKVAAIQNDSDNE